MKHRIKQLFIVALSTVLPHTIYSNTYYQQAEQYKKQGKTTQAIASYTKAIKEDPHHFEAHFNLGTQLFKTQQFARASERFKKALELRPDCAQAHFNRGLCLAKQDNPEEAIAYLQRAIVLEPKYLKAHLFLGDLLTQQQDIASAQKAYEAALLLDKNNFEAQIALARNQREQKNMNKAVTHYRKAIKIQPNNVHALFEMGYLYNQIGDLDNALQAYERIVTLDPDCTDALCNLAHTQRHLGNIDEAQTLYELVLNRWPHHAHSRYGYAEVLLKSGNFEQGWVEFESRYKRSHDDRGLAHNQWDGESDLNDKTILLRAEYGQGDSIQFIRFAQELKKQGATVVAEVQHTLVDLLSLCPYLDTVIAVGSALPEYDCQLPLMSLPRALNITKEDDFAAAPYLQADTELEQQWSTMLAYDKNFKIGICWEGSPYYDNLRHALSRKAVKLKEFEPLADIPGVSLYSLQKINGTDQLKNLPEGFTVNSFGDDFDYTHGRFMDTAAVIKNLDLIITVDTSVAHLAGALGKNVWVLLPSVADWRWMTKRADSPWYPTMKLFRQTLPGNWHAVMEQVAYELTEHMRESYTRSDKIMAEISVGELIDKITILEIKKENLTNVKKLNNVSFEYDALTATRNEHIPTSKGLEALTKQLYETNKKLWDIEDDIRDKERNKVFDEEFISLARSVYFTNDKRCAIKRKINELLGSRLVEEKSYAAY